MKIKDIIKIINENDSWKKELERVANSALHSYPWGTEYVSEQAKKEHINKLAAYQEWLETEIQL